MNQRHCEEHSYATRQSREIDTQCHASEGWHPDFCHSERSEESSYFDGDPSLCSG